MIDHAIVAAAVDDLLHFHGVPPFHGATNTLQGDLDYMTAIRARYSASVLDAATEFVDLEAALVDRTVRSCTDSRSIRMLKHLYPEHDVDPGALVERILQLSAELRLLTDQSEAMAFARRAVIDAA
jgi:hypothetical protein